MQKNWKFWFTLVEVILACSIFAIVVVWIIMAINRSYAFMNNIKLSVRATNLAREWVEMVYNIRDTNRRRHSWNRDWYWLNLRDKANPTFVFLPWIYILKEDKDDNDNTYVYAKYLSNISAINAEEFYSNDWFWKDNYKTDRDLAKLTFDWEYSYYEWDALNKKENYITWNKIDDALVWNGLEFYRIVRVFGVYAKNTSDTEVYPTKKELANSNLTDWTPAEMRFCVKVFYRWNWEHATELCSIMTNFMK